MSNQLKEIMIDIHESKKSYFNYLKDTKAKNVETLKLFEKEINKVLESTQNKEYFICQAHLARMGGRSNHLVLVWI
jgi:hypothetical protein